MALWHKCRCGAIIPQDIKMCPACMEREQDKAPDSESRFMVYNRTKRDQRAAAFYVSADWKKARDYAFNLYDGLDYYALTVQHRIERAAVVHHITELLEDWTRRLDPWNLIPLSESNHGLISAVYRRSPEQKTAMQEVLRGIVARRLGEVGGYWKV